MPIDLYNAHFGFRERPFTLSPDPDFLFWSKSHLRAFSVLEYGLMTRAPLTVVTGEVGIGKTTLVQALLRQIDEEMTAGLLSNVQGDRGALIRWVLNALDVEVADPRADYVDLFQKLQDFVLEEYAAGRRVVLIIDEAQNLGLDTLEELRMLTNINSGKDELLQMILVGQPELRDIITRPELRQFAQRVSASYHLEAMDAATTKSYIRHRLEHAGGTGSEISVQAMQMLFDESGGVPRIVNKLCDLALVYAASAGHAHVGIGTVRELIDDGLVLQTRPDPLLLTRRVDSGPIKKAAE